jgi:hypothetical protein
VNFLYVLYGGIILRLLDARGEITEEMRQIPHYKFLIMGSLDSLGGFFAAMVRECTVYICLPRDGLLAYVVMLWAGLLAYVVMCHGVVCGAGCGAHQRVAAAAAKPDAHPHHHVPLLGHIR